MLQQRAQKRASDEEVEKMKRQTMSGHDLSMTGNGDMQDIAQRMVKSSGSAADAFSGDTFDERSIKIEVPPHQGSRSAMGQFKVVMHAASSGHWKKKNLKVNWILLFPKTTV